MHGRRNPLGGLVQASNGNFYGTTNSGGSNMSCAADCGSAFEITPTGVLTTVQNFDPTTGTYPNAGLALGTDGNLYGTTYSDGAYGQGTIFKMTLSGGLTVLYNFCFRGPCGYGNYTPLVQATNGKFYGTTLSGGGDGEGTVFGLSVGLGAFVETQPTSGVVGAEVEILGSNLNGATRVNFNGTAATFKVISHSLIRTTVPAGATTGPVQVVTPSGTLTSNVSFQVLQ